MNRQLCITTDFTDDGGPIAPKLELCAAAGFSHVHWCEHWSRDVLYEDFYTDGVGRALVAAGLKLLDVHGAECDAGRLSSADEGVRRHGLRLLENRIRFAARLGGDAVVVHSAPFDAGAPDFAPRWAALARSFEEIAPLCEQTGVRAALENSGGPTPPEFFSTVESVSPKAAGYCFDCGHANLKGGDPDLPLRMGARLCVLHLHDNNGQRDQHALPGTGTIDWDRLARSLRAIGYAKPLNFELSLKSQERPAAEFLVEGFRRGSELAGKLG